jgi:hypothetical protein
VFDILVELDLVAQVPHFAIDPDADEACLAYLVEGRLKLALAGLDQRRQDHDSGAFGHLQDGINDLLRRLLLDGPVAFGAVRVADAGEQQPQVVVDFGDGADRRARVVAGALLVDRDRRRQARDVLDVGLVHLAQELARVARQALDIAPLPLGIDGVEGQRRLAAARQPGDDHQAIPRERQVDVLEVVLPRTADLDPVQGHSKRLEPTPLEHAFQAGESP